MRRRPRGFTLFPYTTLFRSAGIGVDDSRDELLPGGRGRREVDRELGQRDHARERQALDAFACGVERVTSGTDRRLAERGYACRDDGGGGGHRRGGASAAVGG